MEFIENAADEIVRRLESGIDCKRCKKNAPVLFVGSTLHCVSCGESVMLERIDAFQKLYRRWPWYARTVAALLFALGVYLSRDGTVHLSSVGCWIAMVLAWRYGASVVRTREKLESASIGCKSAMRRARDKWLATLPSDKVEVADE